MISEVLKTDGNWINQISNWVCDPALGSSGYTIKHGVWFGSDIFGNFNSLNLKQTCISTGKAMTATYSRSFTGFADSYFYVWAEWEDSKCPTGNPTSWKSDQFTSGSPYKRVNFTSIVERRVGTSDYQYTSSSPYQPSIDPKSTGSDSHCNAVNPTISWPSSTTFRITW